MALDPDAEKFIQQLASRPAPAPGEVTIEAFRAAAAGFTALSFDREEVASVRDVTATVPDGEDVRVRVYAPSTDPALPIIVWAHGGTWVRGDIEGHDAVLRHFANRSGCIVAGVDQRLAPEAPHPAPLDDVYNAARWVQAHAAELGGDPERIAIAGDSSGGSLAAGAALRARDSGDVRFAYQLLIIPALDMTLESDSWDAFDGKFLIGRGQTRWAIDAYAADTPLTDPLLSPLHAPDVSGLPPTLIFTAEFDPLREDGRRYAAKLEQAGVPVTLEQWDGLIHHAVLAVKAIPAGRDALDRVADAIGTALRAAP